MKLYIAICGQDKEDILYGLHDLLACEGGKSIFDEENCIVELLTGHVIDYQWDSEAGTAYLADLHEEERL